MTAATRLGHVRVDGWVVEAFAVRGFGRGTSPADVRMLGCHLAPAVDPVRLVEWCRQHLGSPPTAEIFRSGRLSAVIGLRLADGREVVVKVRPDSPRIAACVEVQRHLFRAGYPCPQPLTGAVRLGEDVATAEAYVPGGALLPSADHAARAFAEVFARLIRLAPRPAEVSTLDRAPGTGPGIDCGPVSPKP